MDGIDDVVGLADARVEWEREVVKTMHKVGMDLVKRNRSKPISRWSLLFKRKRLLIVGNRWYVQAPGATDKRH